MDNGDDEIKRLLREHGYQLTVLVVCGFIGLILIGFLVISNLAP
jgi:hypothetical protein